MAKNDPLRNAKEYREAMEPDGFMHRHDHPDFQPYARGLFDELLQIIADLSARVEMLEKKK